MSTPFTLSELKTELTTDPKSLGLAAKDDGPAATALNALTGAGTDNVPNDPITSSQFIALLDGSEVSNLTLPDQGLINMYTTPGEVEIGSENVQAALVGESGIFTEGNFPNSRAAIIAESTRLGSRAEFLWGNGIHITSDQVAAARAL